MDKISSNQEVLYTYTCIRISITDHCPYTVWYNFVVSIWCRLLVFRYGIGYDVLPCGFKLITIRMNNRICYLENKIFVLV